MRRCRSAPRSRPLSFPQIVSHQRVENSARLSLFAHTWLDHPRFFSTALAGTDRLFFRVLCRSISFLLPAEKGLRCFGFLPVPSLSLLSSDPFASLRSPSSTPRTTREQDGRDSSPFDSRWTSVVVAFDFESAPVRTFFDRGAFRSRRPIRPRVFSHVPNVVDARHCTQGESKLSLAEFPGVRI